MSTWPPPNAQKICQRCGENKRIGEYAATLDDDGYYTRDGHAVCRACHIDWSRGAQKRCREATESEKADLMV